MVTENLQSSPRGNSIPGMCPTEVVETYPLTSMLCLVGLWLGVGLLLGHTLSAPLGHLMRHEDSLTEKITGQVREALKRAIPDGLAIHFS